MILQSLYERYTDLTRDPESGVCPPNFSVARISFVLEIDSSGDLINLLDVREMKGKKLVSTPLIVPEQGSRTSGVKPYFLCDKLEYMVGFYTEEDKQLDAMRKFAASKVLYDSIIESLANVEADAVSLFYSKWSAVDVRTHPVIGLHLPMLDAGGDQTVVFRIKGVSHFAHENQFIQNRWNDYKQRGKSESDYTGQCLVTGFRDVPIASIHETKIKGVKGAQQAGANLVSFNAQSFTSYDKKQSYNSPVSLDAVFGYSTALNHMLASQRHSVRNIGDMTVVFWTKGTTFSEADDLLKNFIMDEPQSGEQKGDTEQVQGVLNRIRKGDEITAEMLKLPAETAVYALGLAPNNSRLSIRFFWNGEFGTLIHRLQDHAGDFRLSRTDGTAELTPTLFRILGETVRQDHVGKFKIEDISPTLSGDLFRAIVFGHAYPFSFYVSMINRIRSDHRIEAIRVASIKAYLIRYANMHRLNSLKEALSVSLNKDSKDVAYRLGRLFAILEKAQQDAAGARLNATIKDRYFGAASATPATVFPVLIKLAQHHNAKAEYGGSRDRDIQEILADVEGFPSRLDLTQQGLFILGYYQQKQEIYTKKPKNESTLNEERNDNNGN